jgi:CHAD domain-containing protein
MRVAARRIRSILKSFSPLLDESWATTLAEELAWIARELGAIRDTEVLLERLDRHADHLGGDDGPLARSVIDPRLEQRLASSRSGALGALRSDRHEWLLDDLVGAAASPVVGYRASVSCMIALPPLIDRAWRALEGSVTRLTLYGASEPWHRARIKAKRARYAVEAVAPTFGKQAGRFAEALADLTEVLGEHHDAVVAQETIREFSDAPGIEPRRVFALGQLHAYEAEREHQARRAVFASWSTVAWEAGRSGLVRHAGR